MIVSKGPTPEELRTVSEGAALAASLPHMEKELEGMIRAVRNQMFSHVEHKTLTPEIAFSAWMEVHSYEKLLKRMKTRVTLGTTTGEEIAPMMKLNYHPTGE